MAQTNLSQDTTAVADSLHAMIERELTIYCEHKDKGYLNHSDPTMITADDRMKLVDWCYIIADHCQHSRETVASAMEMVDRFLSTPSNSTDTARVAYEAQRDPIKFQLLTITALYVAIKINETIVISSDLFADMCSSQAYIVVAEDIEDMERILLSGLSWRCRAPTAYVIGRSIMALILPHADVPEATWDFVIDEMKYLTELAVRDYYFSTQRASTVALAAIFNAVETSIKGPLQSLQKVLEGFLLATGLL
eukprot:scaffold13198_cov94-Skeletonema_dohrnii-CCMP3373.AAC.5